MSDRQAEPEGAADRRRTSASDSYDTEKMMEKAGPSLMELSSMPLDPIYAWGIVLEPVEVMIERTSRFVVRLAWETYQREQPFDDEELEERFLTFFDGLVEEGTLRRLPDAPPEMGRRILGPGRWLDAQRIRIERLVEHWQGESPLDDAPSDEDDF